MRFLKYLWGVLAFALCFGPTHIKGVLQTESGLTFETPAPGTHEQKARYLQDETIWRGKKMRCEWAELTKDGIPFHCVAIELYDEV